MRQLTVCFVTIYLALANGQFIPRGYEYANKDVIHEKAPFVDNKVSIVCTYTNGKKCKIFRASMLDENSAVQSCDLNPKYTVGFPSHMYFRNAGKDNVVMVVGDGSKAKLVTVNMVNCDMKKTSIEPDANSYVAVVPKADTYDVVFQSSKLCKDFLCKATYDYDGKLVKEATAFGIKAAKSLLAISLVEQGFLVVERRADQIKVHFVRDDDQDSKVLFSSAGVSPGDYVSVSSTDESKLGFCALIGRKVTCQQYDATGKTKNLEIERWLSTDTYKAINVLNLEKGLLVLTTEYSMQRNDQRHINLFKYDEQGKQVKSLSVDLNCQSGGYVVIPVFLRNSAGEYCVTILCPQYSNSEKVDWKYSRHIRCFTKAELD